MLYRYRAVSAFNSRFSFQFQSLSDFFATLLGFLLAIIFSTSNVYAQPLRLEALGAGEHLLEVAPFRAELKANGYVYLDEPKSTSVLGTIIEGSGNVVYVPNSASPILLSNNGDELIRSNTSSLMRVVNVIDINRNIQETVFYRPNGESVNAPVNEMGAIFGITDQKIFGRKLVRGEPEVYSVYDAESEVLSSFGLPTVDPLTLPQFAKAALPYMFFLISDPALFPLSTAPVSAITIFAMENGVVYGQAQTVNPNTEANFNTQSTISRLNAPFALFPDGTSMRYDGALADVFDGGEVEQGVIFSGGGFGTADGNVKSTSLGAEILGVSLEDGFVYGKGNFFNPNMIGVFSLEDGSEIASLELDGRVYDVEYLGDGKFTYLADIDGALIRGQVQVVPLPAAVWLFATALFGLLSLRRMSR